MCSLLVNAAENRSKPFKHFQVGAGEDKEKKERQWDINLRRVAGALSEGEGDRLLRDGILQVLHTGCQGCSLIRAEIRNGVSAAAIQRASK